MVAHLQELGKVGEDGAEDPDKKNNIVFNATSEFCRTLGDIPTYGLSGNREDQEDIMVILDEIAHTRILRSEFVLAFSGIIVFLLSM